VNQTGNRLFSNYQNNRVLAVGHALLEIAVFGEAFADVCIANARALAAALAAGGLVAECEDRGFTASNQFLVPLGSHEDADYYVSRCAAADAMASVTRMPDAGNVAPRFGVRVGLQELTRKGYLPQEMGEVAECFLGVLQGRDPAEVRRRVAGLVTGHSTTYYAFESGLPPG
jgi:glycine hydroxymethyltransferase